MNSFQDSLESLPDELRRNFTLMHDLDVKNRTILREVDAASDEYFRKIRELSPGWTIFIVRGPPRLIV